MGSEPLLERMCEVDTTIYSKNRYDTVILLVTVCELKFDLEDFIRDSYSVIMMKNESVFETSITRSRRNVMNRIRVQ